MNTNQEDYLNEPHAYKRKLPHIQPVNATYFITFRLAGSIPKNKITELQKEQDGFKRKLNSIKNESRKKQLERNFAQEYFLKYDTLMDAILSGPVWLRDNRIAQVITQAIHYRDNRIYDLLAYCIMPNHVHMVFYLGQQHMTQDTDSVYPVTKIMQSLKRYTARDANKLLERSGIFWQRESYDHIVRNNKSLKRVINYTLNNPIKAGLVENLDEWKWSYCKETVMLSDWM